MDRLKFLAKNPINWIILIAVAALLYFVGGIIIKILVSILILIVAYWISKFSGPYMKKRALRRTIDDMTTRRTNWDGTLKQANQMYEINKVSGYFMPYVFAIIFIIGVWTAKDDDTKSVSTKQNMESVGTNEPIENDVTQYEDHESSPQVVSNVGEDHNNQTISIQYRDNFPIPESIYTGLLNPDTRDFEKFYSSLKNNGFYYVELHEYCKDSIGSISFEPGSGQDVVYISIFEYDRREIFEKDAKDYFSSISNCDIDFSGDGTIVISYNF